MNAEVSAGIAQRIHGTKVDNIYRVLLTREKGELSWYSVAKYADVSYGWAYRILKGLEEEGIIKGHKVKKPRRLFEKWAKRPDTRKYREYHIQDPLRVFKGFKFDYALTGHFAENLINGYLFPRFYDIYIQQTDALSGHRNLVKNGYVGKGNVRILLTEDHVFFERRTVDGWPMISIQQLIVDLIREGAECVEAADILIQRFYHD
jgi:hypothetical protein